MKNIIFQEESYNIIRACISVHKELGCGFLEAVYQEALAIEFRNNNIPFKKETSLDIYFRNIKLNKKYIADFICYDKIILELKAISKIATEHEAQLLNYLKATGLKLGILINFGQTSLTFKRLVL
jgi:GxxExxY protein